MNIWIVIAAYIVDRIVGDPSVLPHPVVLIGKLISFLEHTLRPRNRSERSLLITGGVLVLCVVLAVYGVTWGIVTVLTLISPLLGVLSTIWLISTTISAKGLTDAAITVFRPLSMGQLQEARQALSMIVGRDTVHLDQPEISRATIETVAENIVDGVISPIFFALLGGAPLAMVYRAINTMDSMLGYRNEKYLFFGRAAARLDDVANWIPARITVILIAISAWVLRFNAKGVWKMTVRDARNHPSPNSGYPEASVAGALDIQLGGVNTYQGVESVRAKMGDRIKSLSMADIQKTIQILHMVGWTMVAILILSACVSMYSGL